MKTYPFSALAFLAVACLHAAPKDEKLPAIPKEKDGRYGVYSFEDAQKEALKKKQPMAFIATDERAEDLSVVEAAKKVFWGLEKYSTIVVLNNNTAGTWKTRLPAPAAAALTNKDLGKEFPKVVVVDQKGTVVLGTLTGAQAIDMDEKAVKEFSKRMDESNKNPPTADVLPTPAPGAATAPTTPVPTTATPAPAPGAPMPAPSVVAIKDAKQDSWTNNEGRTIQATLVEAGVDKVVFLMPNGSKIDYPVSSLNAESKAKLEALKAANK